MDLKGYNGWDPKHGDYKTDNKEMEKENLLLEKKRKSDWLVWGLVIFVLISGAVFFFYNYSRVK